MNFSLTKPGELIEEVAWLWLEQDRLGVLGSYSQHFIFFATGLIRSVYHWQIFTA
jgi:hypothetical protein